MRRRGGPAVLFAGRFVAFLRAVTPALAGPSQMRHRTFLAYNAAGDLGWGIGFTLVGHLAGGGDRPPAWTAEEQAPVADAVRMPALPVWEYVA